jgi:hypothetical protein
MPEDSERFRVAWDRRAAYQILFLDKKQGEDVLNDLANYCGFLSDGFDADPCLMAYNAGRRSVFVYIAELLKLSNDDIHQLSRTQGFQ